MTRYSVETGNAQASVSRLGGSLGALNRTLRAGGGGLASLFGGGGGLASGLARASSAAHALLNPIAALVGVGGLGGMVAAAVELNSQLETASTGLAGMLQAAGAASSIGVGLGMSSDMMALMRRDAETLPGTFQDVLTAVRSALPSALAAGADPMHAAHLAARTMAVGTTMGLNSATSGRELAMMLEGRAGAHVALFARMRAMIGLSARDFNKLAPAERLARVEHALDGFNDALAMFANSWDALWSSAKDHALSIARLATQPLFHRLEDELKRANDWFNANEASIDRMAAAVGTRLAGAFGRVLDVAERLGSRLAHTDFDVLRGHAVGGLAAWGVGRAALGAIGSPGLMGAVGGALGIGGGTATAGLAAIALPLVVALAEGGSDTRRALASLESSAMSLWGSMRQLYDAMAPAIAGFGRLELDGLDALMRTLTPLAQGLAEIARVSLAVPVGLMDWADRANRLAHERGLPSLGQLAMGPLGVLAPYLNDPRGGTQVDNPAMANWRDGPDLAHALTHSLTRNNLADTHQPPAGTMHVTVRIEQTINDSGDPDRVLVDTTRAIRQALQFPIESPTATTHQQR